MPPLLQGWGRICFSLYRLERERERDGKERNGLQWFMVLVCINQCNAMYVCMYVCIGEAVKGWLV